MSDRPQLSEQRRSEIIESAHRQALAWLVETVDGTPTENMRTFQLWDRLASLLGIEHLVAYAPWYAPATPPSAEGTEP